MRPSAVLAIALALLAVVATSADLLFLDYFGQFIILRYPDLIFAGVGLIVALRRPRHPIGWLFLAVSVSNSLGLTSRAYAWRALVDAPGTLPGGDLALLLSTLMRPLSNAALSIATLVFPTGRPLSRRWVWLIVGGVVLIAARTVAQALAPTPLPLPYALSAARLDTTTIPNPLGISGPAGEALGALTPLIDAAAAPFFLISGVGLVVRLVRSRGVERLQLKWFVYATSLWLGFLSAAATLPFNTLPSNIGFVLSVVAQGFIPVSVGIAILRYRLYDIDLLIKRTVVYGATTAALAVTFFAGIVALQAVLRPLTSGSELAVAASTLASFALFQPLRRLIQSAVDRRFDRSRYDAAQTLDAFADRLRDEIDLDALRAELLLAVGRTMAPTNASLWLREGAR
ncbi:MAG: hypothetical protein M3T56_18285 [Chloroflexota bacterium]|nr:hypothetical protein [Chloroflexota bacterium]